MLRPRGMASIALALSCSACEPPAPRVSPSGAPAATPSAARASTPTTETRTPAVPPTTLAFLQMLQGPFATAVPPTVVSSGDRIHVFAPNAGSPPGLRYVAIGSGGAAPPDSALLPGTTIVAATPCGRTVAAILRTGNEVLVVSIGENGRMDMSDRFALPDRPWASMSAACASGRVWIVGMTTGTGRSVLWTAPIEGGKLGTASETVWTERTSALSSTVLGGDIVLLRAHGDRGGATLMRLRGGRPVASVPLDDAISGTAKVARVGDRVAVVWSATDGERQSVRLRVYDAGFAPTDRARELADVAKPERLGVLDAMPGPRSLLAVSYFTSELTDETIELPNGRSEPAERRAQYLVSFDAVHGTTSAALRMSMTGGPGAGGWAGDDLLFLVGRFSSVVARYRVH